MKAPLGISETTKTQPAVSANTTNTDTSERFFSNEQQLFNNKYTARDSLTEAIGTKGENADVPPISRRSTNSIAPLSLPDTSSNSKNYKTSSAKARNTIACIQSEESQATRGSNPLDSQSSAQQYILIIRQRVMRVA